MLLVIGAKDIENSAPSDPRPVLGVASLWDPEVMGTCLTMAVYPRCTYPGVIPGCPSHSILQLVPQLLPREPPVIRQREASGIPVPVSEKEALAEKVSRASAILGGRSQGLMFLSYLGAGVG